jgi:hypothetical protein
MKALADAVQKIAHIGPELHERKILENQEFVLILTHGTKSSVWLLAGLKE